MTTTHPLHTVLQRCLPTAALLLLSACTSPVMYHKDKPVEPLTTEAGRQVKLGYVEVDDMGELQDFNQLTAVTKAIKAESAKQPLRLILFVHGWNNNADGNRPQDSGSLQSFQKMLKGLADAQGQITGGGKVFGVFVGWRGRTMKGRSVKVDFYHRYQGGERVGSGAGTDAIYEVAATAKAANPKNVVILVGHSFGGLVLEEAISQPIRARLAEAHAKVGGTINSRDILPADLVVLLNEAQHALKARQLVSALRERQIWTAEKDLPWIVSVTSQTDKATGKVFPIGVTAGRKVFPFNLFNTAVSGQYRKDDIGPNAGNQQAAAKTTAGHFAPLRSHEVTRIGDWPALKNSPDQRAHILANLHPIESGRIHYRCSAGEYEINRVPESAQPFNTTPYWIMSVPKEIIADHSDIWTPRITGLVTALIHLRSPQSVQKAPPAPAPKLEQAPEGRMKLQLQSL